MTTWRRGREIVTAEREQREGSLREFVGQLRNGKPPMLQVPGTAIFLNRGKQTAPLALRANVEHNHVRHEQIVIMSIETEPVPRVPAGKRIVVDDLGYADDGIIHVTARYGYMETHDVPNALTRLPPATTEGRPQLDEASYFLSTIELERGKPDDGALAQATVHRHLLHHRRCSRTLRPTTRPYGHHGLAHRGVDGVEPRFGACERALTT